MSKSDKMYAGSPALKRDKESGKVGVSRPTKADAVDMGVGGDNAQGNPADMPIQVHQTGEDALKEMHGRHATELTAMHDRHQKEFKDFSKKLTPAQKEEAAGQQAAKLQEASVAKAAEKH